MPEELVAFSRHIARQCACAHEHVVETCLRSEATTLHEKYIARDIFCKCKYATHAVCISDIICLTSRWIIVSPFLIETRLSSISVIDALWPRQFQSHDNFSSPAKTVRHASLCHYLSVWIIVSHLPPRFLKRDVSVSSALYKCRMLQFYARVVVELELRYVQRPLLLASQPSRTAGSDFSIYMYIY